MREGETESERDRERDRGGEGERSNESAMREGKTTVQKKKKA